MSTTHTTYLHLNVKNTDSALLCDIFHRLHAGTVVITAELRMLDEPTSRHQVQEGLLGGVVVFASILLTWARGTSGVYAYTQRTLAEILLFTCGLSQCPRAFRG